MVPRASRLHRHPGQPDPDGNWMWHQAAGSMVYSAFKADSHYWRGEKQVMINSRVSGIDALLGSLRDAGITQADWDHPETGCFARIHDPDGNPIELWEPPSGG